MSDPSKASSSSYKTDRQKYEENWDRIFNKNKENPQEIQEETN